MRETEKIPLWVAGAQLQINPDNECEFEQTAFGICAGLQRVDFPKDLIQMHDRSNGSFFVLYGLSSDYDIGAILGAHAQLKQAKEGYGCARIVGRLAVTQFVPPIDQLMAEAAKNAYPNMPLRFVPLTDHELCDNVVPIWNALRA